MISVARSLESNYAGRLAPSPTGLLHLGHARTFWIAFERASAASGKLWLRDDDLDPQRSRPEFSTAMKQDLRWLGIDWDAELRQSERLGRYRAAMLQLLNSGYAYACTCSRRDLQMATQAPHEEDDEPVYTGCCRSVAGSAPAALRAGVNYRFRVPDGETIRFDDLHAGPQSFTAGCTAAANFGDFLLWRKALNSAPDDAGLPSYQLACVVDDADMAITEVVRGRDLLKSTARQILLQRALGLPMPRYFHCDLLRDAAGVRLAKRHDALSLRALQEAGLTPEQVRERF